MKFSYELEYLLFIGLRRGILCLPAGVRERAGAFFGRLFAFLAPGRRKLAIENIETAYPGIERGKALEIARECFDNIGRVAVEFLAVPSLTREKMEKLFAFENEELLKETLALGKGVLILTCHQGNWEYTNLALAASGYKMNVVGRRQKNPKIDTLIANTREYFGSRFITHRNAVRPVLRALSQGEIVGFLLDQRARAREGVLSEFFGRPVSTNPGLALIALRSGSPVIFCRCERVEGGFRVRFDGPIEPPPDGDRDEKVAGFTREFDRWMERSVRARPGQWFWVHARWKLPEGMSK